jgi:outer membrane receptor protein involved in Fe transport
MASAVRQFGDQSFVQELRLVSDDGGNFDYVLGLYYQDQTRTAAQQSYVRGFQRWYDAAVGLPLVISDNDFQYQTTEDFNSTAIFGELTWHVNDRLDVTGGVRAFENTSESDSFFQVGLYTFYNLTNTKHFDTDESDTLFKLNAAYRLDDDNLLYATISEGFRRGGSNPLPTSGNFSEAGNALRETYTSDSVTNYEVGAKGAFMGARYDISAFYIDWEDAQLNTATPAFGFFFVANAGAAHTSGLELQLAGDITDNLSYNLGYTYLDAQLDEDFCDPGVALCTSVNAFDLSGNRLPGAPEHAINLGLDYTRPMGQFIFNARVDGFYQSETRNATAQSPSFNVTLPGFAIFNATTTLSLDDWDFSLWVKNIADEEGVTGT